MRGAIVRQANDSRVPWQPALPSGTPDKMEWNVAGSGHVAGLPLIRVPNVEEDGLSLIAGRSRLGYLDNS